MSQVSGSAGEFLVDQLMAGLGWARVGALGGLQAGCDGIWRHTQTDSCVALAIRTRTDDRQWKPLTEKQVSTLRTKAAENGAEPLFVALTITKPHVAWEAKTADAGEILFIGACSLKDMETAASAARKAYAATPYLRGKDKGQNKPESGCLYAICWTDLDDFPAVLDRVSKETGA